MYKIGDRVYNGLYDKNGTITGIGGFTSCENYYTVAFDDGTTSSFFEQFLKPAVEKTQEIKLTTEQYIDTINETLQERGKNYGDFDKQAAISQRLKTTMHEQPNWNNLDSDMKESLEMIQHKIARILNGNPYYHDSWHDISGYAKLVADRLDK